ncbi:hypothetical protein Agub_g5456 [Astrephomene gubernaculifera]|uniref:Uncharacterized protein n=1 Tax=Astrephomene gubernaculifera TaxID=47775 RepID=A0AAD3HK42_9CHLO|nr:hypothetical protein Agub_g5456 [Astrephomene gubernaculifera]
MPNDNRGLDGPDESATTFGSLPPPKATKYAWMPSNEKVNHENFHRMLEEYRTTKKRERDLEMKIKQLGAQLARTEEAAKRALVQTDSTAKGGAAQKLLDAERAIAKLRAENADLTSKLAREKKRSADYKSLADTHKQRLDSFLRDQRHLVKRVGELERSQAAVKRRPEEEFWGEEAGRRFVAQQEELVALKEENAALKQLMESDGPVAQCKAYEGQINELQNLVKFYERKLAALVESGAAAAAEAAASGPGPEDWVLEEFWHNDEMYLLDRKTGKLFTVPGDNSYPRPLGIRNAKDVRLGCHNSMERFLATLDSYLVNNAARLQEVFAQFDADNSGQLNRRETARLLMALMPDLNQVQVEELRLMLDADGNGLISLQELLDCIKEAFAARTAAKVGRNIEVNDALDRIRDVLRLNKKAVAEAFEQMDSDKDSCLSHLDAVKLLHKFLPDMVPREVRYLLSKLQQWDVVGEGRLSCEELYQALELARVFRVGLGLAGAQRTASPERSAARGVSPTKVHGGVAPPSAVPALRASARVTGGGGGGMKEAFMRERVTQLEAELREANRRNSELEDDSKKVEVLQRDVALYKARIEELERDFMRIDVLGNMEGLGGSGAPGDEQLKKAWEIASTFKKRFLEHKGELDNIRLMYARMQAQLDDTHKLLHEEHRKRFKLEDEITRLNVDLMRIGDLESRLTHEKGERIKLEREYLALQQKALSAPGEALAEVRSLREELFAVKREKATAQQKEAEVRLELSHVRSLLDGMNAESYRVMQDESDGMKKRVASLTLELQAARDKLAVYMRTAPLTSNLGADLLLEDDLLSGSSDRRPDADKSPEELRRELIQLRDVWRLDQGEIKKLHKVLETESAITLEAKAALEEAHREMERLKRDLQGDLRKMERELERRDEKIRKLELQLRGAYSGINRALRSSTRGARGGAGGLRDSLRSDTDDFSEIAEEQNVFELHVTEAQIYEEALGKDPSVFFTFDFFMHETQATPVLASNAPSFNTLIQYVVDSDPFLLEYLDSHVMALELCRARGYDYDVLGVARVPLRQVLEDLEIGAALGYNRAYHYADVFGADGRRLGRVRYGYCFRRPLDSLLQEYRAQARSKRAAEPDERDPATGAVQQALTQAGASSCIKVIIERCEQLLPAGGSAATMRPYVHYRFPGHRQYHDTRTLAGASPVFNDEAVWPIARTTALEADLRTRNLTLVVFDDAQSDDPLRAIVGVASVPLAGLASGVPVEGAFKLTNPVTRQPAGRLVLGLGWHNPLQLPGAPPKAPAPKVPISSELRDEGAPPDFSMAANIQELLPVSGPSSWGAGGRSGMLQHPPPPPPSRPGAGLLPPSQYPQQQQQGRQPAGGPGAYDGHGLLAELGGNAPSGDGFGLAAASRGPHPHPSQPPPQHHPHPHTYGASGAGGGGGGSGFGLAAEAAARQQPPQRPAAGSFGLDAEAHADQYSRHYQQQQQQSSYGQQQSPLRPQPYQQPSALSGRNPPDSYGLGAEMAVAGGGPMGPGAGLGQQQQQRQGSFSRPTLPGGLPPPPQPLAPSGAGGRYGGSEYAGAALGGDGGSRRPNDGAFGLEVEAAGPARGGRPPSRQHSGGLVQQQQPPQREEGFGLGAELQEDTSSSSPPPRSMMLSSRAGGRSRYADTELSLEAAGPRGVSSGSAVGGAAPMLPPSQLLPPQQYPQQQQQQYPQQQQLPPPDAALDPVLRRERAEPAFWSGLEHRLVLCLHSLELTPEALRNPRLRNVVLMHSLLSEQGGGISELDTCTQPLPKGPGELQLGYCVSYNVLAPTAASELHSSLSGAEDFSLEVKLMSTAASRLDMSSIAQPGTLQTAGYCMLPLADIWSGRRGNLIQERIEILEDSDDMAHVATLTVTLMAEAALRTLRQQQMRR